MKKALMILGGLVLLAIVVALVYLGVLLYIGRGLDKESKDYADTAIQAIVSGWRITELQQRATPKLKSDLNAAGAEKLFAMFRRLGNLKEYKGSTGEASILVTPERGKEVTAKYVATTQFDAGPAEITLSLIKQGDQWQIGRFVVDSPVFLAQPDDPAQTQTPQPVTRPDVTAPQTKPEGVHVVQKAKAPPEKHHARVTRDLTVPLPVVRDTDQDEPPLKDAFAYVNRGADHIMTGNYRAAIKSFDRAIELDRELAMAYYDRGIAWELLKERDRAIADYRKASELGLTEAKDRLQSNAISR
jgi:tetratricopeptide (TPR) repeat protein